MPRPSPESKMTKCSTHEVVWLLVVVALSEEEWIVVSNATALITILGAVHQVLNARLAETYLRNGLWLETYSIHQACRVMKVS